MGSAAPAPSDPLDRLNRVERELLTLLGCGHTAKSIATLKGLSVAAVNERFRAARRKTGLGSSREIARLLVAQKNRDDLIDLASGPGTPQDLSRPDPRRSRRASPLRRWRYPMLVTGLFAVALLAQQTSVPPAPAYTTDGQSIVADILARQPQQAPDMAALHAEAAGAPDPVWSKETEATLKQRYNALPGLAGNVASFSVTCGAAVCEVAGVIRPDLPVDQINALVAELQNPEHVRVPGLEHVLHHFGSTADRPANVAFASYWGRRG